MQEKLARIEAELEQLVEDSARRLKRKGDTHCRLCDVLIDAREKITEAIQTLQN